MIDPDEPKLSKTKAMATCRRPEDDSSALLDIISKFSSWPKLSIAIANAKGMLKNRNSFKSPDITTGNIQEAEETILKREQQRCYLDEIKHLERNNAVSKSSKIRSLTPFLDKNKMLRMNSRTNSPLSYEEKYPIIVAKSELAKSLIHHYHDKFYHQGPIPTPISLRQAGYWVIGATSLLYSIVRNCITNVLAVDNDKS